MNTNEVLKLALEYVEYVPDDRYAVEHIDRDKLVTALREALAEQPAQQAPVAWTPINQPYPPGGELDILMGDGSILCEVLPQADGDLWWGGASTGERFIDPKYASVTHWRIHAEHTSPPAQRTWVGLTDVERRAIRNGAPYNQFMTAGEYSELVQKATEAKLKEKNQ